MQIPASNPCMRVDVTMFMATSLEGRGCMSARSAFLVFFLAAARSTGQYPEGSEAVL